MAHLGLVINGVLDEVGGGVVILWGAALATDPLYLTGLNQQGEDVVADVLELLDDGLPVRQDDPEVVRVLGGLVLALLRAMVERVRLEAEMSR